ncbi:MAG TPA: hypothetical protein VH231_12105 [Solirubrobacteraceae bacterium]|jgi:hypothetical protein|nr:hypothetical protein [Solirubrobacteraceae bacterium]
MEVAEAAAGSATPRARRRLRRLLAGTGGRRVQRDLTACNRALAHAYDTDEPADRAVALERLAQARASHAALRRKLAAVPDAGASGRDAVAAMERFDLALVAFAQLLISGPTPEALAAADRAPDLVARATADLVRVYEELA